MSVLSLLFLGSYVSLLVGFFLCEFTVFRDYLADLIRIKLMKYTHAHPYSYLTFTIVTLSLFSWAGLFAILGLLACAVDYNNEEDTKN